MGQKAREEPENEAMFGWGVYTVHYESGLVGFVNHKFIVHCNMWQSWYKQKSNLFCLGQMS